MRTKESEEITFSFSFRLPPFVVCNSPDVCLCVRVRVMKMFNE